MIQPKVLFVDDQKSARDLFVRLLDPARYTAVVAQGVVEAEQKVRSEEPDVIVTDLRMPDVDGLEGLRRFLALAPHVPVIVITAFGTVETAVEAMRRGAFDYVSKPFDPGELEIVIGRAVEHRTLVRENARLRSEVARRFGEGSIVASAPAMRGVLELVTRVAPTDCSILLLGESGTGKDLLARHVHQASRRSSGPYVAINCSAIPEHLLESELFGHEEGAFSGATKSRTGFFAEANGGTLFLDEIGDMSTSLQPKLLRVLESGEFYRVGSRKLSRTEVRIICASNRNIEALVKDGKFRQDLFYRINTVCVRLPPLRERREDIPALAERFLARSREARSGTAPKRVGAEAMQLLLDYSWPGNVREMEHVVERASVVCDGEEIRPKDLPAELGEVATAPVPPGAPAERTYKVALREFERGYFAELLERCSGNVQKAAELAGIHRTTLYDKLAKLDLKVEREEERGGRAPGSPAG